MRLRFKLAIALPLLGACSPPADEEPAIEAASSTGGQVTLTPVQEQAAGIATVLVAARALTEVISATATLEALPDLTARLGSRVAGRVTRVLANVGDTVAAGELVIYMDAPELGRAKADYLAALKSAEVSRQVADREQSLFRERISSEREWQRAEAEAVRAEADRDAAENVLHALGMEDEELEALKVERHYTSTLTIRTPVSGIVVERAATPGQMVQPSDVLLVMDLRRLWVLIDVFDTQLAQIRPGQRVLVRTRAWADREFEGRVDQVGATVEAATRAVKVRVALDNPAGLLRPGMFADVRVEVEGGTQAPQLAVPASAIQEDAGETIVFVALGGGRFVRRAVVTGTVTPTWVGIAAGLAEGERVVTAGGFVLKSEIRKADLGEEGH